MFRCLLASVPGRFYSFKISAVRLIRRQHAVDCSYYSGFSCFGWHFGCLVGVGVSLDMVVGTSVFCVVLVVWWCGLW